MSGSGITRRGAASLAAAGALLPLAALGAPVRAASIARVQAPAGIFRLERILTRELGDGKAIVVTRHWSCRFSPTGRGIAVTGEQIACDVAAPPNLESLAALERARRDAAFPLALDDAGQIVSTGSARDAPETIRALDTARALFASVALSAGVRREARQFIAELGQASATAISRMPRDLFFPVIGSSTSTRVIALPGGGNGTITVAASAAGDAATGLLTVSDRLITTRIEGSIRSSGECWALERM